MKIKLLIILSILLSLSQASSQIGCRFCSTCGGDFPYSGGKKRNTGYFGDWLIFGNQCADAQPHIDRNTEWSLCCTKDYELDDGTCKFCSECGSDYPYEMGSRVSEASFGGFDIMLGSCSGYELNSMRSFKLCCSKPGMSTFCNSCDIGQVSGGAKINQGPQGPWTINSKANCRSMNSQSEESDEFNICSNPCFDDYDYIEESCIKKVANCSEGCSKCSLDDVCTACENGFTLQDGICYECQQGYYSEFGSCKSCITEQCTHCTSPYLCTMCLNGNRPVQGYYSFKSGTFSASKDGISVGAEAEYHEGTFCFSPLKQLISLTLIILACILTA